MATLTPDHLFEQADRLLTLFPKRKPRQTEIRRAISAAYYGMFHFVVTAAADEYVGAKNRAQPHYTLAYRSIAHRDLRGLCLDVVKPAAPAKLRPYMPQPCFGRGIRGFAAIVPDLADKRHDADYNPSVSFVRQDAQDWIGAARSAVARFESADQGERQAFPALLLFSNRPQG